MGDTIVMLATSGGGLGHLSRALAVAKSLRDRDPAKEIIFVTSSSAIELIRKEGFFCYYIPSRRETSKTVSDMDWMSLVEALFRMVLSAYQPKAVVYDAAYPYGAVTKVLREQQIAKTIWLKRECYKAGMELLNELELQFGQIITPKEFPTDQTENTEKKYYVDPIVNIRKDDLYERKKVREHFRVKETEQLVYVQLGLGMSEKRKALTKEVVAELRKRDGIKILLGEYITEKAVWHQEETVIFLQEYPVARYFKGIDAAISAAGYNSFHELLGAGVPTLFLPNTETVADDQCKRAMFAKERQYAMVCSEKQSLGDKINQLFEQQELLHQSLLSYQWTEGAVQAADYIIRYMNSTS